MPRRSPEELGLRELGGGVAVADQTDQLDEGTPARRSPEELGLRELRLTPQGLPTLEPPARIPPMMPSHQVAPTPTAGPATAPTQMKAPALLPSHPRTGPGVATSPYDTRLTPDEETQFQSWKQSYAPKDSGQDYDLRGAFKAGLEPDPATGHWPDTYKKPNHPTFSNESQYADYGQPGSWQGEQYTPANGKAEPQVAPVAPKPINPKGPTAFPVLPLSVEAPPQPAPKEGQTADISQRAGAPIASIPPALISPEKAPYGTTPEEQVTPPGELREVGNKPTGYVPKPSEMYLGREGIAKRAFETGPQNAMRVAQQPLVDLSKFVPEDQPLVHGIATALSQFTSPQNIALMVGTGALGRLATGAVGKLISLGFGADQLSSIIQSNDAMTEAADNGDWDKVNEILGQQLVSGVLAQSLIRHGTGAAKIGPQIEAPEMPSLGKMAGMPQEPGQPFPDWYLRYQDMRRATVRGAENLAGTLRGPKTGEILPVEPQAPQARQQLTEGEPVVTVPGQKPEAPRPTPETKVETPTPFEGPVEKTWLPEPTQLKPSERMLPAAEPYVEKIIKEKEQAEEQRDQARREVEIDVRTGQGSATAFKRALPAAEADPKTEIGSLDLANLKARNDLDSPAAGDREIEAAADSLVQAATELGVSPRVFTPKGDELYIFGPTGKIQPLVDRAAEIYGKRKIGDSNFDNYIRGGVGPTLEAADAAMSKAKFAETFEKYRELKKPAPEEAAPVEQPKAEPVTEAPAPQSELKGPSNIKELSGLWPNRNFEIIGKGKNVLIDVSFGLPEEQRRQWASSAASKGTIAEQAHRLNSFLENLEPKKEAPTVAAQEHYAWNRNAEGGQAAGNIESVYPLHESLFNQYVRPLLAKDTTFSKYKEIHPNVTHISLIKKADGSEIVGEVGSLEEVRPAPKMSRWWRQVSSPTSPEAKEWIAKADSEPEPTEKVTTEPQKKEPIVTGISEIDRMMRSGVANIGPRSARIRHDKPETGKWGFEGLVKGRLDTTLPTEDIYPSQKEAVEAAYEWLKKTEEEPVVEKPAEPKAPAYPEHITKKFDEARRELEKQAEELPAQKGTNNRTYTDQEWYESPEALAESTKVEFTPGERYGPDTIRIGEMAINFFSQTREAELGKGKTKKGLRYMGTAIPSDLRILFGLKDGKTWANDVAEYLAKVAREVPEDGGELAPWGDDIVKKFNAITAALRKATLEFTAAMQKDPTRTVVMIGTGRSAEDQLQTELHEKAHIRHLAMLTASGKTAWTQLVDHFAFLNEPLVERAIENAGLSRNYSLPMQPTEVVARLSSGESMGLSIEEMTDVFKKFFDMALAKHGDRAYTLLGDITPILEDPFYEAVEPSIQRYERWRGKLTPKATSSVSGRGQEPTVIDPEEPLGPIYQKRAEGEPSAEREELTPSQKEIVSIIVDPGLAIFEHGFKDPGKWLRAMRVEFPFERYMAVTDKILRDAFKQIKESKTAPGKVAPSEKWITTRPEFDTSGLIEKLNTTPTTEAEAISEIEKVEARLEKIKPAMEKPPTWSGGQPTRFQKGELVTALVNRDPYLDTLNSEERGLAESIQEKADAFRNELPMGAFTNLDNPLQRIVQWAKAVDIKPILEWAGHMDRAIAIASNAERDIRSTRRNAHLKLRPLREKLREAQDIISKSLKKILEFEPEAIKHFREKSDRSAFVRPTESELPKELGDKLTALWKPWNDKMSAVKEARSALGNYWQEKITALEEEEIKLARAKSDLEEKASNLYEAENRPPPRKPGEPEVKLTPQQQKKYLLDRAEKALAAAPERKPGASPEGKKARRKWVTIDVPGDGYFNIFNDKTSLSEFIKKASTQFPASPIKAPGPPAKPSRAISNKRVVGEGIEYYNEFRPRRSDVVTGGPKGTENSYEDGFYSNGTYAILTERPKGIEIEPNAKMKGFLESPPAGLVEGKIVGEFLHQGTQLPILHVTAPSRSDRFIDPIYADAILTKYPNAKAFVPQDEKAAIYFKEGGKVVGIVGPLKAQIIPDSLAERAQELSPGRKAPGGAGQADMGGYADRSGSQAELFMDKDEAARRGRQGYAGYEPTGGEAPPPGKSYMDKSRGIVRLPEIIQIIRAVNENKIPGVKKYLGQALGRFIYNNAGTGDIQVKADIFLGELLDSQRTKNGSEWDKYQVDMRISLAGFYDLSTIVFKREWRKGFWTFMTYRRDPTLAAKVIAHELGHMVDWLGDPANAELDKTLKRGNILGRIATLKGYLKESLPGEPLGDQPLTEAEKEELKKQAARELRSVTEQEVDEIIRTETNYTPDDILEIFKGVAAASTFDPKLYEFIQRLDRAQKKLLIVEALKGRLAETRPPTPKKIVETPTGNKIKVTVEATPEMIAARYRELIEAAMRGRQLLERKVVTEELKRVTHIWKPFMPGPDSYTKYRYSSKELYADAISVLMNEPELLRKEAPTFYHGLFAYIDRKPDVKDLYDQVQEKLGNTGDLMNDRLSDTYDMFKRGYEIRENLNIQQQSMVESIKDSTARYFIDKMHGPLKHIRVMEKAGGERAALAKEARYQLEEIAHLSDAVENYFYHIGDAVLKPLKKNGITPEQLGAYLFLRRAAFERTEIANPLGQVEAEAKLTLEGLKHSMGEEKFQQLQDIAEAWREVRQRYIIPEIVQSRFYSEEINDLFLNNPHYARFNVLHHLEKSFGTGVTVKIHKQYGTLSEIENPFVATVLQDIAMMRATAINNAKRALVRDVLTPLGEAKQPEMKWNSFTYRNEPKQPRDPHKDLLPVMENGKLVFYEVSREITRSFENEPYVAKMIGRVWGMMNQGIRDLLVSRNPIWMARNVVRDMRSTYKNLSEIPVYGDPALGRIYLESFKEAWKDTMSAPEWLPQGMRWEHERSGTISEMRAGKMLIPGRMYESSIVKSSGNAENEVERMARSFEIDLGDTIDINAGQSARALASVKWVYDVLGRMGQVSEMTGKIAGYKYLTENQTLIPDEGVPGGMRLLSGRSKREIGHMVRGRVSTPDIKKQGEGQAVTNNLFLFSNVNAQGLRAAWESFKEDKSGYAWKTIATNMLPKIIMWGIGLGIAGGFARRMTQGISEYDKAAYTIVPLGMNKNGKTVYMRIPEDYEGQYWGAITWMMLKGQVTDAGGVINQTGEQVPWNISKLNPFLKVAWRLYQYYGLGVNPTDEWRGRTIMPDRVFKAGGSGANIALGKQVWKDLGGSVLWNPSGFELNTDEGVWERISRHLPFNILGTFIKVSDQGISDQLDQISKATTKETAKRQVDVQSRIIQSINAAQGKPNRGDMRQLFLQLRREFLLTPQTSEKEFESRYFSFAARTQANPYINRIINATTNLEKERLLQEYRKMLTPQEYDDIINRLATSRAEPSVRKVEKQSRREPSVQPVR